MTQAINCNFSRTAVHSLCQREFTNCGNVKKLLNESIVKVVEEYNRRFSEQGACMQLPIDIGHVRIRQLLSTFNKKWHPQSLKETFLSTFSLTAWTRLPLEEKSKHTLQNCSACHTQHLSLTRAFPDRKGNTKLQNKVPMITFNKQDLSSSDQFGKKALKAICGEQFNKTVQEVICETPRSKLIIKPSRQAEMRRTVRLTKRTIQQSMDENGTATVMGNRISWRKFDKVRKAETLENRPTTSQTPSRKRANISSDENTPPAAKRKHHPV